MKIKYMKETDSMFIIFSDTASVDSVEIDDGVVADVDKDGNLIGLEFYSVKNKFENSFETVSNAYLGPIQDVFPKQHSAVNEPKVKYSIKSNE